jgi:hypothetical protein
MSSINHLFLPETRCCHASRPGAVEQVKKMPRERRLCRFVSPGPAFFLLSGDSIIPFESAKWSGQIRMAKAVSRRPGTAAWSRAIPE